MPASAGNSVLLVDRPSARTTMAPAPAAHNERTSIGWPAARLAAGAASIIAIATPVSKASRPRTVKHLVNSGWIIVRLSLDPVSYGGVRPPLPAHSPALLSRPHCFERTR